MVTHMAAWNHPYRLYMRTQKPLTPQAISSFPQDETHLDYKNMCWNIYEHKQLKLQY